MTERPPGLLAPNLSPAGLLLRPRELAEGAHGNRACGAWLDRMVRASVRGSTPVTLAASVESFLAS